MTFDRCYHKSYICRNAGRMHPPRLTVGPFVLKLKCTLHRMNMGDNMNIIDDANTFLFKDLIRWVRRTFWGKHWAYNDEPFPAKYEMHVGMTWQFHDYGWLHILEWCFSRRQVHDRLTILMGCWHDAYNQSKDNSQKNPGEKILHDESSSTTLGGRVKLDERCKQ